MAERVGFYLSTTAILLRFKHMPTNLSHYNALRMFHLIAHVACVAAGTLFVTVFGITGITA
jgi:hypothetical protein